MEDLIRKYERKLIARGLSREREPLLGAMDAELVWNRKDGSTAVLEKLFRELSITALLFSRPREPWGTIIDYLCETAGNAIYPEDSETRTFFHDFPIARSFSASALAPLLKGRKCVIVPGRGVVTTGTVSLEQAFVAFNSVCFASFVAFFSGMLTMQRQGRLTERDLKTLNHVADMIGESASFDDPAELATGPFRHEHDVCMAMEEAGRTVVSRNLVDSYFGNLSYRLGDILYISQTGSSLDELRGCIDPCPLDGSSCAGLTASSELSLHLEIARSTEMKAILHGHPCFSVIISMDCDIDDCTIRGDCHRRCPRERSFAGTPILPG
ncbi:MAG TPA: rRNA adenine dimethylase, partial [Synergistetes bacterium]|nr:rRNA adenine dimethylase [Synergistota bacterium]